MLCGLEAVLAAIAFAYTLKKAIELLDESVINPGDTESMVIHLLFPGWMLNDGNRDDWYGFLWVIPVLIFTGIAVWTGISHTFCVSKQQGPGNSIETGYLERARDAESLVLHGVDMFDYREVVGFSLSVSKAFSAWVFYQLFSFVFTIAWIFFEIVTFNFSSKGYASNLALVYTLYLLWLAGCARVLLRNFGLVRRFRKLEQACRTQPRSTAVQALLVVSSVSYAYALYLFPAVPSVWRWSLAVTHVARSLKLLFSLRGRGEVAVEAGGEIIDEML